MWTEFNVSSETFRPYIGPSKRWILFMSWSGDEGSYDFLLLALPTHVIGWSIINVYKS